MPIGMWLHRGPEADDEDKRVELEPGDKLYTLDMDVYLRKTNIATELAVKAAEGKVEKTLEEMLPPHYVPRGIRKERLRHPT